MQFLKLISGKGDANAKARGTEEDDDEDDANESQFFSIAKKVVSKIRVGKQAPRFKEPSGSMPLQIMVSFLCFFISDASFARDFYLSIDVIPNHFRVGTRRDPS